MISNVRSKITRNIKIIFELLLPDTISFDQDLYISAWKQCINLYNKGLIDSTELIIIGCVLQTRKLPKGKSLGAFTNKQFFDILEFCSTLAYKILFEELKDTDQKDINYLISSTEDL
jgi:hypothetical protein